MTISTTDIYGYYTSFFITNAEHSYIQIKLNAILFNQNPSPKLAILIIDDDKKNLFEETIEPTGNNPDSMACTNINNQTSNSGAPFFIDLKLQSSTNSVQL